MGHHRKDRELRVAQRVGAIGNLGDVLRPDHQRAIQVAAAEVDLLAGPPGNGSIRRHDDDDERTPVARAGDDPVGRPAEQLLVVALELGLEDGAVHRSGIFEQDDGVGAVLDRHELVECGFGEPCLREVRKLHVEQLAEQICSKRRVVPDQLEHTLVQHRRHGDTTVVGGSDDRRGGLREHASATARTLRRLRATARA
jgi:hypothetical protein